MPNASDLIEVHFKDRRFILAWTTIKAFPKSLLAEKLDSIEESCTEITFDREAGQFALIKQLMIYRNRTRKADILGADKQRLHEELEFFRLEELLEYVLIRNEVIDVSKGHRLTNWITRGTSVFSSTLIKEPTLVLGLPIKATSGEDFFNTFDYSKYHVVLWDRSGFYMAYYTGPNNLVLSYDYAYSAKLSHLYIFLSAIDRFDHKQNLLIGHNHFRKLLGQDIVLRAPKRQKSNHGPDI